MLEKNYCALKLKSFITVEHIPWPLLLLHTSFLFCCFWELELHTVIAKATGLILCKAVSLFPDILSCYCADSCMITFLPKVNLNTLQLFNRRWLMRDYDKRRKRGQCAKFYHVKCSVLFCAVHVILYRKRTKNTTNNLNKNVSTASRCYNCTEISIFGFNVHCRK